TNYRGRRVDTEHGNGRTQCFTNSENFDLLSPGRMSVSAVPGNRNKLRFSLQADVQFGGHGVFTPEVDLDVEFKGNNRIEFSLGPTTAHANLQDRERNLFEGLFLAVDQLLFQGGISDDMATRRAQGLFGRSRRVEIEYEDQRTPVRRTLRGIGLSPEGMVETRWDIAPTSGRTSPTGSRSGGR
ncbi:hypothetical protein ACFLRA_02795, partial [Bdellovibrionota bacterium]